MRQKFDEILNIKQVEVLSFHESYDHKIELTKNFFNFFKSRIYSLSFRKLKTLKIYLKENLTKKFVNFNKVFNAFFILFIVKFNEKLKFCVNYRKFNVIIKRNVYFISLINEIFARIMNCKYMFKLNIIVAFNKFRLNFKNKNFTTFICSLNIYKYYVLSFEFINDSAN